MGLMADMGAPPKKIKNKHVDPKRTARRPGRINLKSVAEVLEARGMDPTEALVNILQPMDEEGNALSCRLPPDIQARILNELLQYTQPKLKSIEIRGRLGVAGFNPSDEQARAMAEEFLRGEGVAGLAQITNEGDDSQGDEDDGHDQAGGSLGSSEG